MAKQKPVKCPYCGQMIDRDYEFDWKKIGNRYWHDECYAKSQEEKEKNKDKQKKQRLMIDDWQMQSKTSKKPIGY